MPKHWIIISSLMGFLGVALGAFGAHALKENLSPELLDSYRTGVQYHLIHTAVLLALSLYGRKCFILPAFFILLGIVLFSFSLYIYSVTGIKGFAMITPFGGLSLLVGWALICYNAARLKADDNN